MTRRKYEKIQLIDREEAQRLLYDNDEQQRQLALWSIALHDDDWKWAQDTCLDMITNAENHPATIQVAIQCIGHIARIHGKIDVKKIREVFSTHQHNPQYSGYIHDVMSDIGIFFPSRQPDESES